MAEKKSDIILGYWGVQGLGQVARYLLEYTGLNWSDKIYSTPEEWQKDKAELGFDFPNVPYIIDGDKKITESSALLTYIPLRAGQGQLLGGNESDKIQVFQLLGVLGDARSPLSETMWVPKDDFETKKKANFENRIIPKLTLIQKYLGTKEYLLGYITVADFYLFYIVDIIAKMDASYLDNLKALKEHHARIAEIPSIKKYRESERFPKLVTSPKATWTGA